MLSERDGNEYPAVSWVELFRATQTPPVNATVGTQK